MSIGDDLRHLLGKLTGANERKTQAELKRVSEGFPHPETLPDAKLTASFVSTLTKDELAILNQGNSDHEVFHEAHGHRPNSFGRGNKSSLRR